jgi:dihydropyrimidinase
MYDLVVKHGRIITPAQTLTADVAINGDQIAAIGEGLTGRDEIAADGMLVTPGAVDIHVHMQMSLPNGYTTSDTFFTGTRAAALGGTTAIVDFAEATPNGTLLDAIQRRRQEADRQVAIDYGLHMTLGPNEIDKLDQVPEAYQAGCATFKLYMAYGFYLDDGELLQALQAIAGVGGLSVIHAENWRAIQVLVAQARAAGHTSPPWHARTRPARLEGESVGRAIDIATYVGTPLHIFHVGCTESVRRIAAARAQGLLITGETCPQYLMLSDAMYERDGIDGALPICAPPLRPEADRAAMWQALADNDLQIVATDHCPFTISDKQHGYNQGGFDSVPGGVPSVEARFSLVYSQGVASGLFDEQQWVQMCCTRPAQLAGFQSKGMIAPGYDADLCIFDPEATWTLSTESLHEHCDWTPYHNVPVRGRAVHTISRGRQIVKNGVFIGEQGAGRFVERVIA